MVDMRLTAWLALTVTILAVSLACITEAQVSAPFTSIIEISSPELTTDITSCSTVICCPDIPVSRVIDGDSFVSADARNRLFGVDTPERGSRASTRLPSGSGSPLAVL